MTNDISGLAEPERLVDSGPGAGGQMIRAARRVGASPAAKSRLYRRAGWLTAVSFASSYAASAAAAVGGPQILGAIAAASIAAVGVGAYTLGSPTQPVVQQIAPVVQEAPVQQHSVAQVELEPSAIPVERLALDPTPEAPAAAEVERKPGKQPLSHEIKLIDDARSSMRSGSAPAALDTLRLYRQRFPAGRFSLEASALEIEALALAGRSGEAKRRAQAFIESHPNSLLVERVRPHASQ